jgi:hypothetical protein
MVCAKRSCVYAFAVAFLACTQGMVAFGKDDKKDVGPSVNSVISSPMVEEFQWKDHQRLSWNDFQGPVNAATDEAAAATHCGIGFKTNTLSGKPEVIVYNTFYVRKSWVRSDAKMPSILEHEQGHFDLCELYTRKMENRMHQLNLGAKNLKETLLRIYDEISSEYENRQQAYEDETAHGTNFQKQKRWTTTIAKELKKA